MAGDDVLDLSGLQTEAVNMRTSEIDRVSTLQMCTIINDEDRTVAACVTPCLPEIARGIDSLLPRVRRGGRVIYVGAGTSGRLGILDSSEIPPTFAAPPSQFVGLIAGGDAAIRRAQEGAEDDTAAGKDDLIALNLDLESDSVIGIAASGRTPYVLGALEYAKSVGCLTIGVACVAPSAMGESGHVDVMISPLPGPEVITGSTRLKAGTATKLVLNMLSTGTMIKAGKTYGNMMVDMMASNRKLKQRSRNILRELSKRCDSMTDTSLDDLLARCDGSVKLALVVAETDLPVGESRQRLHVAGGVLVRALTPNDNLHSGKSLMNGFKRRYPVLCVDGGGSKCAAVVATSYGVVGMGVAGPCNLSDGDFESTVGSIVTATERALKSLNDSVNSKGTTNGSCHRLETGLNDHFSSVWIATAGMDRTGLRERVIATLSRKLRLDQSVIMRVTNDVDLLAAAMSRHPEVTSSIVMIAGTGSVAIRYSNCGNEQTPSRVARCGGWGHLLGDEGAGYAIGRQAICQVLSSIEDMKLNRRTSPLSYLEQEIVSYFHGALRLKEDDIRKIDLLSKILMGTDEQSAKARIAGVAQVVLSAVASGDHQATDIVSSQAFHLIDTTLGRLLDARSNGSVVASQSSQCGLILSGSVMLNEAYQTIFQQGLAERGIQFAYIESVPDAALVGVEYLLSTTE